MGSKPMIRPSMAKKSATPSRMSEKTNTKNRMSKKISPMRERLDTELSVGDEAVLDSPDHKRAPNKPNIAQGRDNRWAKKN